MFLEQPEADAMPGPVSSQAGWFRFNEDADTFFDLADDDILGFLEYVVQGVVPVEWYAWFQ